jgi:hypothetical protein
VLLMQLPSALSAMSGDDVNIDAQDATPVHAA